MIIDNEKISANQVLDIIIEKFDDFTSRASKPLEREARLLEKKTKTLEKLSENVENSLKKLNERIEHLEETFLYLFHNIKKNQFLYSHYPDDWVKEYLDVKEGLKYENKYLDRKIEEKTES